MIYDSENSCIEINDSKFKIYAHENELLNDHILKVLKIFKELSDENVLRKFFLYFYKNNIINLNFNQFNDCIEKCIFFHDFGKLSFNFQICKLNKYNESIRTKQEILLEDFSLSNLVNNLESDHSFSGALSLILYSDSYFKNNNLFILMLVYAILGHHTNIKDFLKEDKYFYDDFSKSKKLTLKLFASLLGLKPRNQLFFQKFFSEGYDFFRNNLSDLDSQVSFFYMYIYSLLIVSDVFASDKYNLSLEDFEKEFDTLNFNNRISSNLLQSMNDSFFKGFNSNINLEGYEIKSIEEINSVEDINVLRTEMLLESSANLLKNIHSNNIFFLHMPTGGGKTNTSMKLALDILENTSADRIFYAMPFINIIEQNFDVICDFFGLSEENNEIRKIYSGSETIFEDANDEFKNSVLLNDDFFNYPVICTTFVGLFNSIIENNKKSKYKLQALTNSVIILDEIQSLPLKNWNSLYYIINELANNYNVYFIIMSATLPDFNHLKLDYETNLSFRNISLIDNPSKYFNHRLFNRSQIIGDIKSFELNEESEEFIEYLANIILENFSQGFNKGLMVFNTIKSSKLVFDKLSGYIKKKICEEDVSEFKDLEIDLLNSSLMPARKREIISNINNLSVDKKYVLISTQSVEAGVDVSFDFVVRDFAIIDSIEQIRGRCNRSREINKRFSKEDIKGKLYLIRLIDKNNNFFFDYIYDDEEKETRIKSTEDLFSDSLNYSFEDIENYYSNVSKCINEINNLRIENLDHLLIDNMNIKNLNVLKFSRLMDKKSGIHLISKKQEQFSIFIPADVSVFSMDLDENIFDFNDDDLINFYNLNKSKFVFSINELKFIKSNNLNCFNSVSGEKLVDYYKVLLDEIDRKEDYFAYKLLQKEFSSILYKFIINISLNFYDELYSKVEEFKKIGFFYVLPKDLIGDDEFSIYSLKRGFNYNPTLVEVFL